MRESLPGERAKWSCDICGVAGSWSRSWQWYGSIAAEEGCGHIIATCSDACRDSKRALELVRAFDMKHAGGFCRRAS